MSLKLYINLDRFDHFWKTFNFTWETCINYFVLAFFPSLSLKQGSFHNVNSHQDNTNFSLWIDWLFEVIPRTLSWYYQICQIGHFCKVSYLALTSISWMSRHLLALRQGMDEKTSQQTIQFIWTNIYCLPAICMFAKWQKYWSPEDQDLSSRTSHSTEKDSKTDEYDIGW